MSYLAFERSFNVASDKTRSSPVQKHSDEVDKLMVTELHSTTAEQYHSVVVNRGLLVIHSNISKLREILLIYFKLQMCLNKELISEKRHLCYISFDRHKE